MNITVELPDNLYQNVSSLAERTNRKVDEIIADKLEDNFEVENIEFEQNVSNWSDEDVLALANSQMPSAQSERMSELLDREQAGNITNTEKSELNIYIKSLQFAALQKSFGLAEAVKRELINSPKNS